VTRFAIQRGGTQCIGAATSAAPEGPFEPVGSEPFICQVGQGGPIDPGTFVDDDGTRYISSWTMAVKHRCCITPGPPKDIVTST
jgi:hypothetical protein